jgi:hypothetical protein
MAAPVTLPTFFNGVSSGSEYTIKLANEEIDKLINQEKSVDLRPYFWPHFKRGNEDKSIFRIPDYAVISSASFARRPAVFSTGEF